MDAARSHRKELKNLSLLHQLDHPNLVKLLASYTHDNTHNLLFELAENGDLNDFLGMANRHENFEGDDVYYIALANLSSGLEHVHNFAETTLELNLIGCHHDLRPRNIILSDKNFILADFGLSNFKEAGENSATPFDRGRDDYLAPECMDLETFQKGTVHRSSDIWSFGCIMAEILTFMVYGATGIKQFQEARRSRSSKMGHSYFFCSTEQANKGVTDWLSRMEVNLSRAGKKLLSLVRDILSLEEQKRPKAKEVSAKLRLVSLTELINQILHYFSLNKARLDSPEMLLEEWRIRAWAYALDILETSLSDDASKFEDISDFSAALNYLHSMRKHLNLLSSQDGEHKVLALSPLQHLNNSLDSLLSPSQQHKSAIYFKISVIDNNIWSDLNIADADLANLSMEKSIRVRLLLKHMTELVMAENKMQGPFSEISTPVMIDGNAQLGHHDIGRVQDGKSISTVLVEWRSYRHLDANEENSTEIFNRVGALTSLLREKKPDDFRALNSRGFFHDAKRQAFGIVYDLPGDGNQDGGILRRATLQDVIAKTYKRVSRLPILDDRFNLASMLAKSISEFHAVGWLHKSLMTSNVALFSKNTGPEAVLDQPFIIGFNHSRPNEEFAFSEGLRNSDSEYYHHPLYRSHIEGYRAEFDYYSLGIILLQIGLWRPINEIASVPPEQLREHVLKKLVPLLPQSMGMRFYEATKACIEGINVPESGNSENDKKNLLLKFEKLVVSKLFRIL